MRFALAFGAGLVWACASGAAELPVRTAKAKPSENKAATCEIGGERGFVTPGGGCVHVGGYISSAMSAGDLKR